MRRTIKVQRKASVLGWAVGIALMIGMVALLLSEQLMREGETRLLQETLGFFLGLKSTLSPAGTAISIGAGTQAYFTMVVSTGCSVVLLMIPLVLVAALMLVTGRSTAARIIPTLVVSVGALLALNQLRFVLITVMTRQGGLAAFEWAHTVIGSVLVLAGLSAIIVFFIRVVSRQKIQPRARQRQSGGSGA